MYSQSNSQYGILSQRCLIGLARIYVKQPPSPAAVTENLRYFPENSRKIFTQFYTHLSFPFSKQSGPVDFSALFVYLSSFASRYMWSALPVNFPGVYTIYNNCKGQFREIFLSDFLHLSQYLAPHYSH